MYRDALEKSGWHWTPQQVAAMPIPQMLLVFRDANTDASSPAAVLKLINDRRRKKGLSPIQERKESHP